MKEGKLDGVLGGDGACWNGARIGLYSAMLDRGWAGCDGIKFGLDDGQPELIAKHFRRRDLRFGFESFL